MRVISGSARGTRLKTLSGADIVRPTTDRVKESMFNIIQFSIIDAEVLDLFCGSGALGIEALSRNASHCDFVDANNASLDIARGNAAATHLTQRASFYKADFEAFIKNSQKKYDLIFADPPYAAGFLPGLISLIENKCLLTDSGIFIFETVFDTEPVFSEKLELYKTSVYGKTKILFYKNG